MNGSGGSSGYHRVHHDHPGGPFPGLQHRGHRAPAFGNLHPRARLGLETPDHQQAGGIVPPPFVAHADDLNQRLQGSIHAVDLCRSVAMRKKSRRGGPACPPSYGAAPEVGPDKKWGRPFARQPVLEPLQIQLQKMRGAGDARVIVAHHLFALPGELFVGKSRRWPTNWRRSASMIPWFWAVGGTILASRITPFSSNW